VDGADPGLIDCLQGQIESAGNFLLTEGMLRPGNERKESCIGFGLGKTGLTKKRVDALREFPRCRFGKRHNGKPRHGEALFQNQPQHQEAERMGFAGTGTGLNEMTALQLK
jgi:hypothetical protein